MCGVCRSRNRRKVRCTAKKKRMCPEPLAPNKSAVQKYRHAEFISAPNRTTKILKQVRNDAQSAHQGAHPAKQGAARARSLIRSIVKSTLRQPTKVHTPQNRVLHAHAPLKTKHSQSTQSPLIKVHTPQSGVLHAHAPMRNDKRASINACAYSRDTSVNSTYALLTV